jgi:hypothetical protein
VGGVAAGVRYIVREGHWQGRGAHLYNRDKFNTLKDC